MSTQITALNLKLNEHIQNFLAESESVTKCHRLKMIAEDGKMRITALLNDTEVSE